MDNRPSDFTIPQGPTPDLDSRRWMPASPPLFFTNDFDSEDGNNNDDSVLDPVPSSQQHYNPPDESGDNDHYTSLQSSPQIEPDQFQLPADLYNFNWTSDPQSPPNQQRSPSNAPSASQYNSSTLDLSDLPPPSNQQAVYRSSSPLNWLISRVGSDPSMPRRLSSEPRIQRQTRSSHTIDLTESSPPPPVRTPGRKRKRNESPGEGRAPKSRKGTSVSSPSNLSEIEVVDLEAVDTQKEYEAYKARQQAEAIQEQLEAEANKPVKLSDFQCIICMDRPTNLTITHCGHLFCSECLHSALHYGDKKTCPVCRTAISLGRAATKPPKNGFFALEMNFMTANRKGKQPARAQ